MLSLISTVICENQKTLTRNKATVSPPCLYLFRVGDYEHLLHEGLRRKSTPKRELPAPPHHRRTHEANRRRLHGHGEVVVALDPQRAGHALGPLGCERQTRAHRAPALAVGPPDHRYRTVGLGAVVHLAAFPGECCLPQLHAAADSYR